MPAAPRAGSRAVSSRPRGSAGVAPASPRGRLLELLQRYAALHPREEAVAARIAALVAAHDDCLLRTCVPGHVTASAWIVSADRSSHLLLLHGKLRRWLQPGGHVDGDALPHRAALREAAEETGLPSLRLWAPPADDDGSDVRDPDREAAALPLPFDLDVHRIPARGDEPAHEHHDLRYLLVADGDETLSCSDESAALRWCRPGEVEELTREESVLRLLRKARALLPAPGTAGA